MTNAHDDARSARYPRFPAGRGSRSAYGTYVCGLSTNTPQEATSVRYRPSPDPLQHQKYREQKPHRVEERSIHGCRAMCRLGEKPPP